MQTPPYYIFFSFFTFWRVHWNILLVCLGESRLSQVNNSPRANVFPAGVAKFGKALYRSLERSTQDTRDGFFWYSTQASFSWPRVDLARPLRRAYSRPFRITSLAFVKVCGIRFSVWENFIGFYICCYPITTILACLFSVGVRILWKKLCWMRGCRRRWHLRCLLPGTLLLYIAWIWTNYHETCWSIKDNNN